METRKSRIEKALISLQGLTLGDGFGKRFLQDSPSIEHARDNRILPSPTWTYTDDGEMAIAIIEILQKYQNIEQDELAINFGEHFQADHNRGYGAVAYWILHRISEGNPWKKIASTPYSGTGSLGNGAAMRSAPVGAYFYDNLDTVIEESKKSAEITHAHPEGQAGAIAVSLMTALLTQHVSQEVEENTDIGFKCLKQVVELVPDGETKRGIEKALGLEGESPKRAGIELGTGKELKASDTVPLALWCVASNTNSYENAIWSVIDSIHDLNCDVDTLCAMVGGIVANHASIPREWLHRREDLKFMRETKELTALLQRLQNSKE